MTLPLAAAYGWSYRRDVSRLDRWESRTELLLAVASWLVERASAETEASEAATRAQVDALTVEVRQLRAELARGGTGEGATENVV